MAIVTWSKIDINALPALPATITVPWLRLVDTIRGATHLMINATGTWNPLARPRWRRAVRTDSLASFCRRIVSFWPTHPRGR